MTVSGWDVASVSFHFWMNVKTKLCIQLAGGLPHVYKNAFFNFFYLFIEGRREVSSMKSAITRVLVLMLRGNDSDIFHLYFQGDMVDQEGDSQSQGSATWLVDPKESKRTISTKYETTIF